MADAATLGTRMAAARAVTSVQTGSPAPAAASTGAASTPDAAAPAADTSKDAPASGATTPSDASATTADADAGKGADGADGDADKPQTIGELKKQFVRLDKRERKIKAQRRELNETKSQLETAKADLMQESNRVSALLRHAEQKHAWVAKGQQAWDNDDKVSFAKAIEKMAKGASLASITQWLAGAADKPAGKPAATEEESAWRREKDAWERQRTEEANKAAGSKKETASAEKRDQAKSSLASAFARHPFLVNPDDPKAADPDALQEAFDAYEAAFKTRKPGEKGRDVAKRVLDGLHARELRKLKRLGLEPKPAQGKAPPAKAGEGDKKTGERLPEPPPTNKNGKQPTPDETRAARIAAARRMTEMQRRGVQS